MSCWHPGKTGPRRAESRYQGRPANLRRVRNAMARSPPCLPAGKPDAGNKARRDRQRL
nr:MAG TPA: hypothetical protein [Caudoviricetes sp.]DAM55839.1 MAG TPA: hypothetical protein [Caudoviricetes sp.]